ncbi:MAG: FAD-binding oxidoreductase [Roseovarius sp.]
MISDTAASLWASTTRERVVAPSISRDQKVDLVVIGGGFTGCAAALEAAKSGASVCLLEARTIGHGGSGRNVGLVNAGLWLPPDEIVEILGETRGRRLMDVLGKAPQQVFDLIGAHRIECEPIQAGTLHLAHAEKGLDDLAARHAQGNRIGAPIRLLSREETIARTGSEAFCGALFDPRAGTIQPLAYCAGLARAARQSGALVFEHSAVQTVEFRSGRWVVDAAGHSIEAGALLIATNAYHRPISGAPAPAYIPVHYCQFATAPIPEDLRASLLPGGEGCWDTALVMSSFRFDRAGRMIVGGIGNVDGRGATIHSDWARRKLRAVFPQIRDLRFEHVWTGRIAMTSDHVPHIVAPGPNAYEVFGYSGRGIGPGTVFGTAAAQALLTGAEDALPLPPQPSHQEAFTGLRGTYYEFGAAAMHLIAHRMPEKRNPTSR